MTILQNVGQGDSRNIELCHNRADVKKPTAISLEWKDRNIIAPIC